MADLVRNVYAKFFKLLVIDCRFPYEYTNGHIMNAINITGSYADDLLQKVFSQNLAACEQVFFFFTYFTLICNKTAIVFHCEFSQNRGPDTLRKFRQMDRNYNKENYPRLSYTNVYLLQGGYKEFFPRYKVAVSFSVVLHSRISAILHFIHPWMHQSTPKNLSNALPSSS